MTQQGRRIGIIDKIVKTLREIEAREELVDKNKFIIMICEEHGCSKRTAREYLEIGMLRIK